MRLSRTGCGVVAAGVAGVTFVLVGPLEDRFFGQDSSRVRLTAAAFAAGAVFWLADRLGVLSAPYSSGMFNLRDAPDAPADDVPRLALTPTTRVNERREEVVDFMRRIMNLDADQYFLSDDTTLSDLHPDGDHHGYVRRTLAVYGVDIADVVPPYLWAIAKRIRERQASRNG